MRAPLFISTTFKYTLLGAFFGCCFPIIASIITSFKITGEFNWTTIWAAQATDPLLWIINTAPIFLGLFAYFIGREVANVRAKNARIEVMNEHLAAQRAKEQVANEQLRKINTATQKFVPSAFLRSLGKEKITEVELGSHAEQTVTVSFSDIRNYTTLSEQMTPGENFQFVSAFNSRMSPAIHRHEGFINQYLGDAIMAIFPKHPSGALAAAIEMQQLLKVYNQTRIAQGKMLLRVGMGLHSGSLVMGIIGDDQRMDAATISDTVNVASRIESLTKHFGVNILLSEDTYQQLTHPDDFNCRYLGRVLVKGKRKAVGIYECYDGDSQTQQVLKEESANRFKEGLQQYFTKQFRAARNTFESILNANPQDQPAQLFLEKAAYFIANKVEKEWTGVEKMDWK